MLYTQGDFALLESRLKGRVVKPMEIVCQIDRDSVRCRGRYVDLYFLDSDHAHNFVNVYARDLAAMAAMWALLSRVNEAWLEVPVTRI